MLNRLKSLALRHLAPASALRLQLQHQGRLKGFTVEENDHFIDIIADERREIIRISVHNKVYAHDMMDSFEYFFSSSMPIKHKVYGRMYRLVDFSTQRLHNVTGFDDFSLLCPSLTEPFSTTEQYLSFANLKEGDVAIDLGAYSGLTSIAFSKAVGHSGQVIALEPDPLNFFTAAENFKTHERVNGLNNIRLSPAAVSSKRDRLNLSSEGAMGSAFTSIVGTDRGDSVDVECITLEDVVSLYSLPKVDFIKMDIEGAEKDVACNSLDFFERYRPRMIIEPHHVDGELTSHSIKFALRGIGYEVRTITQSGLTLPLIEATPKS